MVRPGYFWRISAVSHPGAAAYAPLAGAHVPKADDVGALFRIEEPIMHPTRCCNSSVTTGASDQRPCAFDNEFMRNVQKHGIYIANGTYGLNRIVLGN